ncbi:MAG: T9SS type A sorting domain-containing protein [Flavobacteriaceae bacterium]|nr:T9SS type A sorting domain-containing protein [Flavobacteriaceae bacterium]
MKLLYLLLAILTFQTGFAQDPQLFENTWYLHNLVISGQNHIPPNNSEVPFVPLYFFENANDDFLTYVCNNFAGKLAYQSNESFTIQEYSLMLLFYNLEENTTFEGKYLSFFFDATTQETYTEPFQYNIIVNGSEKTLTIENVNGDQAIYGNQILSNENVETSHFFIHPNPVKDKLVLSSNETNSLKLKIFNITGKLLSTQTVEPEKQTSIDVSNFTNGIYFLNIENENGKAEVKKFIKE